MITLACALLLQPAVVAYDPNLRRYQDGDRWVYSLQTSEMPLHTMAVDLKFLKETAGRRFFEARQCDPTGGNKPLQTSSHYVLFGQGANGDIRMVGFSAVGGKFDVEKAAKRDGSLIFNGVWDEKPKPSASVGFLAQRGAPEVYKYVRKENVDTGFASIECAVFQFESSKIWINPKVGNFVRAEFEMQEPKQTMIVFLKETNVLKR